MEEDKDKLDFSIFKAEYFSDAKEGFQEINTVLLILEKDYRRMEALDEIFRVIHTLKSASVMLGFTNIVELAHDSEDFLDMMRKREITVNAESLDCLFDIIDTLQKMVNAKAQGKDIINFTPVLDKIKLFTQAGLSRFKQKETLERQVIMPVIEKISTIKVKVDILDSFFNQVGELTILKNRLNNILSGRETKELRLVLGMMDRVIGVLQEDVSVVRMVAVAEIFQKFPRMVRDLAKEADKEINFVLEGSEIELDKAILDVIGEPILHLLRNAIGHGIELPLDRQKSGKPSEGTIKLSAKRDENYVLIEVGDDGKGINKEVIKRTAIDEGFTDAQEADSLTDKEIYELLFKPGFTTIQKAGGLSGRGVGLDVVKLSVEKLGGIVEVYTEENKGTKFTIKLPPVTAFLQMLMVGVGSHIFAIPSDVVIETLDIKQEFLKYVHDEEVLVLRKEIIPFVRLGEILNLEAAETHSETVAVIINIENTIAAVGVDSMFDITENIVKPFDPIARKFKGFSGGTIMADGRVALLLDIPSLVKFKNTKKLLGSVK